MQTNSKKQMYVVIFSVILALVVIYGLREAKIRLSDDTSKTTTTTATTLIESTTEQQTTTEQETTKQIVITNLDKNNKTNSSLIFAGNLNITEAIFTNSMSDEFITKEAKDSLKSSDFFFANLKTGFSSMTDRTTPSDTNNFADLSYDGIFENLGINAVALANNHIMDYGNTTITSTINMLNTKNVLYVGAGNNFTDATAPLIKEIGGRKIGIVNISKIIPSTSWIATNKTATSDSTPGIAYYEDRNDIKSLIEKCKNQCDIVIAYINCGDEDSQKLDVSQQLVAHDVIDAGASLVIECNTNKILPVEYYKDTPIFYSLGTLLSYDEEDVALSLLVSIDKNDELSFKLNAYTAGNSSLIKINASKSSTIFNKLNRESKSTFAVIAPNGTVSKAE